MAKIRLIKRRIKAATHISQITRAMEMVAASKMKKAQEKALSSKPYCQKIREMISLLLPRICVQEGRYPLLAKITEGEKILVVLISTNKGLCGGLNTVLFRMVNQWFSNIKETDFVTFGIKARNFVLRTKRNLVADFSEGDFLGSTGALINFIVENYTREKKYRQVFLVYNDFLNTLRQVPVREVLLPMEEITKEHPETGINEGDFLIEPNPDEVLNSLLPHYLEVSVRKAFMEAEASEQAARMMAMKAATDNATALMEELTMQYNKERQQVITYEIADIVTAREAIS